MNKPNNIQEKLDTYYTLQKEIEAVYSASAQLHWDYATHMPSKASAGRGEVLGVLAGITHEKNTDPVYVGLVDELYENIHILSKKDKRSVSLMKKSLDKKRKLSKEFVQTFEALKINAESQRRVSKKENDFKSFQPYLEKIVQMSKDYASMVGEGKDAYDVLLDEYEEGADQAYYDAQLLPLKQTVIDLVKQNVGVDDDLVYDDIEIADKDTLKTFLEKIVGKIGFDFEKGVVGIVEHPFASKIGPNDQRINTNVQTLLSSLTGMIHELGHGLYDINSPVALDRTNLSDGVSLGVHESQSRLLENIIGRSDVFIAWILPQLQSTFDECSQRTHQGLKATLNNVQASLIRTEADEVSYNLHILMRYEIEKGLMNGTIAVKDLPDVWNAKMKEYLGVVPKNDSEGCLQDVHWSCGLIGYFPTYMLGNIISGQLWSGFILDHPNRSDEIAKGDFSSYNSWFNTAIRQYGKTMSPRELIKHATGSDLSDTYYTSYLINKYGK